MIGLTFISKRWFAVPLAGKDYGFPKSLRFLFNTRIKNGLVSASPPVHFILGYYNTVQWSDMIPNPLARATACVRLFTPSFP